MADAKSPRPLTFDGHRPTARQWSDWVIATCRMFGATEATTLEVAALTTRRLVEDGLVQDG